MLQLAPRLKTEKHIIYIFLKGNPRVFILPLYSCHAISNACLNLILAGLLHFCNRRLENRLTDVHSS